MQKAFQAVLIDISPLPFFSVEENFIQLETKSQGNTPVKPSDTTVQKGKGKRHSKGLTTTKRWKPIATQRIRKPQNSSSIKGKPALTACTAKIKLINPDLTSKGKFPKAAEKKFVQGKVKVEFPKNTKFLTAFKH
ncbi:hypothetical protein O181_011284 [Austropuccinia psidii MF-1]|uniref:Uncharacterized protein n=1 Tax=Austropuccinia psidii MF-1 TaxID=1389203 RepID=A0A9Q3BSK5_9BASI|nr:hypothetical protein [Austropuccinia psidii MF-1]